MIKMDIIKIIDLKRRLKKKRIPDREDLREIRELAHETSQSAGYLEKIEADKKITPAKILLALGAILMGTAMIVLQQIFAEPMVLLSAGIFFVIMGAYVIILMIAWNTHGAIGDILRSKSLSLVIIMTILLVLLWTAINGILGL